MNGPDGKRFPWGKIDDVHCLLEYEIVEFTPKDPETWPAPVMYLPYVGGRDTGETYKTLDQALVGAIAYKYSPHTVAALYACKVLGIPVP